jgi:hypothetical protein
MLKIRLLIGLLVIAVGISAQGLTFSQPWQQQEPGLTPSRYAVPAFEAPKRSTVPTYSFSQNLPGFMLCFGSGTFQGLRDAVRDQYPSFEEAFLDANKENKFWNPRYYPDGKSKGYTTFDLLHKGFLLGGGISFTLKQKAPWWHYAVNFAGGCLSHTVGYYVIYSGIKR